ncbi:MAG TPA: hypothetical protein VK756_08140 [Solirubrobacteraceae bacterium]|nr:hypothetical protein [Solirubrobacteraceae bacterium]
MNSRKLPSGRSPRNRRFTLALGSLAAVVTVSALLGGSLPASVAAEAPALVQQGAKLLAGEEVGGGRFGRSASLSADGDTALVGGPRDNEEAGAAWVLTRSGSTWAQQAKLTAGAEAASGAHFGRSVALSADGDTALIGAPNAGKGGTVWVFARSGSTWTEQDALTGAGESGDGWFGRSVALSADGDTALVGGYVDHSDVGAAWVFVRSGSTWVQQGEKLIAAGESGAGEFGWSVALSADGATALIGGHEDDGGLGAAWVFARSGATWAQQGEKLTGAGESGAGEFGQDVSLAADGSTALVGGRGDDGGVGAAWVFARSGATWAQQGEKLTGAGESGAGEFGQDVTLSADGRRALVGAPADSGEVGAAWVFSASGATWIEDGPKLTGGEEVGHGEFGWSVALASEGPATALIGGIGDSAHVGAVWVFGEPPAGTGPGSGPAGGGPSGGTGPAGGGSPAGSTTPGSGATTTPGGRGAPTAGQGVAAFNAVGGDVELVSRRIRVRYGRALVELRCAAPVACRGQLTLSMRRGGRLRHGAALASTHFAIRAHAISTVRLALGHAALARLSANDGRPHSARTPRPPVLLAVRESSPSRPPRRVYAVRLLARR